MNPVGEFDILEWVVQVKPESVNASRRGIVILIALARRIRFKRRKVVVPQRRDGGETQRAGIL